MQYFLDSDNDGHWYLVQAHKRNEWEDWLDLDEDDITAWDAPDFADRLPGPPNNIVFEL